MDYHGETSWFVCRIDVLSRACVSRTLDKKRKVFEGKLDPNRSRAECVLLGPQDKQEVLKLMQEIKKYKSAGRMILTGTPLQVSLFSFAAKTIC